MVIDNLFGTPGTDRVGTLVAGAEVHDSHVAGEIGQEHQISVVEDTFRAPGTNRVGALGIGIEIHDRYFAAAAEKGQIDQVVANDL